MTQSRNYRAPSGPGWQGYGQWNPPGGSRQPDQGCLPGRTWHSEQPDLQAYCQQLSYPQLLAPGRPQSSHAVRNALAGLAVTVSALRRRRLRAG